MLSFLYHRVVALVLTGLLVGGSASSIPDSAGPQWPMVGHDLYNSRNQNAETIINPANVATLTPTWVFTTGESVSATPTIAGGALYFPDWAGNLYKVNALTGQLIWSFPISTYSGVSGSISRSSPAIYGSAIIIGDLNPTPVSTGAHVMAISQTTGSLLWSTQVDANPYAIITASPVIYNGTILIGVSSSEEGPAALCCSFRGSVVALNANTGAILWQTYTVPPGYSGGAVWAPSVAVDPRRNQLYAVTGNNYTVPIAVAQCQAANPGSTTCVDPTDYFDSMIALDVTSGTIKWNARSLGYDTYYYACGSGCIDDDFGSGPNLLGSKNNSQPPSFVGAGSKGGKYYARNPQSGRAYWITQVGPGSAAGGIMWGTATDGVRIYVPNANAFHQSWTLVPSGQTVTSGLWTALDPATGHILWQTADPLGASDTGPVTVANGILYAGSMDPTGMMYAIDAATGNILWSFASGGSVNSSPAVVSGMVYWGSGYHAGRSMTSNNKLYAFQTH